MQQAVAVMTRRVQVTIRMGPVVMLLLCATHCMMLTM
jgi:hypothetical protein